MLSKLHSLWQLQKEHKNLKTVLNDPVLSVRIGHSIYKIGLDPDEKLEVEHRWTQPFLLLSASWLGAAILKKIQINPQISYALLFRLGPLQKLMAFHDISHFRLNSL